MKNENLEICKQCQGYCCKKSGCDYIPDDFPELSLNFLLAKLYEGYISIVSAQDFKSLPNGQIVNTPFLYLRARNVNRPIVDLLSMKTPCASLTKMGCAFTYEQRPYGGKNLVPVEATVITPCHQVISDCLIIVIPDGCPRNLVYEQKSKLSYVQEGKLWYIEKEKNA